MAKQSHSALPHYRLRKEYEVIADKALTTPTNTEHLMALKEEIDKVVEKTLPELDTRIIEARHRYCNTYIYIVCGCACGYTVYIYIYIYIYAPSHRVEFLLEHTSVSHSEMRLNADTFRWMERMPPILQEHHDIITRSRTEKEDALKV